MDIHIPTSEGAYYICVWNCLFDDFQEFSWLSSLGFFEANTYHCSLGHCNCFHCVGRLCSNCCPRSALCWGGVWIRGCSLLSNLIDSSFNLVKLGFCTITLCNMFPISLLEYVDASGRLLYYGEDPASGAYFLLFCEIVFDFLE